MQVVVTEVVRGSAGREPPVAGEMENSRRKGERYQGDRVTARMIGCMCNGKTGGRRRQLGFSPGQVGGTMALFMVMGVGRGWLRRVDIL